jgi:SsrA-binding protein
LERLGGAVRRKGYTAVPLELFFDGPWAKMKFGLGKGKKEYDKRQTKKDQEAKREMDRTVKRFVS